LTPEDKTGRAIAETRKTLIAEIAIAIEEVCLEMTTQTPIGRQNMYTAVAMWIAGECIKADMEAIDFLDGIRLEKTVDHYAKQFAKQPKSARTIQ
jgi:hypothetical protein